MLHNRISVTRRRERKGSRKPNRKPPPRGEARNCKKDSNFARFSLLFNCAKKQAELKLIGNFLRRNPSEGLVVLWVKLKRRGYARSLSYSQGMQHGISDLRSNAYRRITDRSLPRRSVRDTLKERNFNRRYSKRYCDRWEYGTSRSDRIRRDTTARWNAVTKRRRTVLCRQKILQFGGPQQAIKEIYERVKQLPDAPAELAFA